MKNRSRLAIAFGVVTMVLGGAAVAWACTPQASQLDMVPSSAPAGTPVTVSGERYSPGGAVEIRWGSETGLELATATGPNFSANVTIPGARAGTYRLVAIDQTTGVKKSGFFTLTAAPVDETPAPVPAPVDETPAPAPAPVDETPAPAPAPAPATPAPSIVTPAPADAPAVSAPVPVVRPRADAGTRPAASPSAPAPAPVPQAAATPAAAAEPVLSVDELSESMLSVDGDLWSGFASGPDSSVGASLLDTPERSSSTNPALAIGIALFATGLVALFGGFATAAVTRRRRARAELS